MDLKDKVILITGASSGIGKTVAEIVSARGAIVALLARRQEKLDELVDKIGAKSNTLAIPVDITDREAVFSAVQKANNHFGRLDIIINSAGLGHFGPIENLTPAELDGVVQTNIYGMLNVTQASIPFLKQSQGMIVNISSGLSKRALPFLAVYAGTKSMVDALSDGMRMELRKYGIKVLNYCPPETETEFADKSLKGAGLEPGTMKRKLARVEDVAQDIVKSIVAEKREVVNGKALKVMNFLAPKMLDNIFYKAMVLKMLK